MKWVDLFETSSGALRANKSRSILTILGIVIGIAAVIMALSVGSSAERLIINQVADLGADLVFAEPAAGNPADGPPNPFIEQSIGNDDLDAWRESGLFTSVDGNLYNTVTVSHEEQSEFLQVVGVTDAYLDIFPADVADGNFITESDVDAYGKVAVLGSEVSQDLFGDQDPVGQKIKLQNTTVRVIGVMEPQGTRFFQNLDKQVYVPLTTAQRDFGLDHISFLIGRAVGDVEFAKEEARFVLRDSHNIDNPAGDQDLDDFFVSSQDDAVEIIGTIGLVLSILLGSIAAISLVVGGIGIMNIMLVSVTERTKEIGLRKSVGATYRDILQQFLLEAVLLTMIGGVLGVVIGSLFSYVGGLIAGQYLAGWVPTVRVDAIFLAVIVSTIVGIGFGIYPARRAAKLDPIEALRYE